MKNPQIIALFVIMTVAILAIFGFSQLKDKQSTDSQTTSTATESAQLSPSPSTQVQDEIFKNALNLYLRKKEEGVDMKNGPCLGPIGDDWVLDIAHKPRQSVDEKPENQCEDFRNGTAKHFIELDPDGKLITFN